MHAPVSIHKPATLRQAEENGLTGLDWVLDGDAIGVGRQANRKL